MRIFLDDKRDPPDDNFVVFRTAESLLDFLGKVEYHDIKEIHFDHDLGPGKSGYDVATRIEEMAASNQIGPIRWLVHSGNTPGKMRIQQAMRSADRIWLMNIKDNPK